MTAGMGLAGFLPFMRNAATPVPASWGVADGVRTGVEMWINAFVLSVVSPVLISFLGALIVNQRPDHPIGRLLIVLATLSALPTLAQEWAIYGYYTLDVPAAGTLIAAWANNWLWVIQFTFLLLTTAIFPEGRFLSRTGLAGGAVLWAAALSGGPRGLSRWAHSISWSSPNATSERARSLWVGAGVEEQIECTAIALRLQFEILWQRTATEMLVPPKESLC